jgi:hypothetical protein
MVKKISTDILDEKNFQETIKNIIEYKKLGAGGETVFRSQQISKYSTDITSHKTGKILRDLEEIEMIEEFSRTNIGIRYILDKNLWGDYEKTMKTIEQKVEDYLENYSTSKI